MTLTVPCLFGLESLVADEMRRLDLKNVRAENGRVHCEGTLADIARLNVNLRCGARVLMELGSFPARDFEALFQGVYALPWENYIPRDGEFPVKGYSLNSQLHSVPACQSIVKKAVAARLDRLARPLQGKSDRDKELSIHAFILENVRYDKLKKPYSHEIIGPLTQGVGVCEGIAKTVKALCDAVGLPCIVALSEAAPEIGVRYRHTWNVVTVEGQRYHVDATFDNSLQRGMKRYDYFNLDDRHIFRDHQRLVLPLPECSGDKGYFYRSLSFTKTEDVEKRVRQALRKKQEHFVFHWRGGGLNQEILGQLLEKCAGAAAERGKTVGCSLNRAQAVIQMDFSDAPAGEVLVEEPDEGQRL